MAREVAWACPRLHLSILRLKAHSVTTQSWLSAFISPVGASQVQWELPGSACWGLAGPTPQQRLQQCPHCHMLSGCSLHTAPLGWGTWKLFQRCEMDAVPKRVAVTDQLLRKPLEQLIQVFAGFDFAITASNFHSCLLKLNLHQSCRLSY